MFTPEFYRNIMGAGERTVGPQSYESLIIMPFSFCAEKNALAAWTGWPAAIGRHEIAKLCQARGNQPHTGIKHQSGARSPLAASSY